jgi:HK97 family phage prohead protease
MEAKQQLYRTRSAGSKILDVDKENTKVLLCTTGLVDTYNTVFMPNCFTDGLNERKRADGSYRIAFLREHDFDKQIGAIKEIWEENGQLLTVVRFGDSQVAKDALLDIRSGILREASTGDDPRNSDGRWIETNNKYGGVWQITKAVLWDASLVAIGSNPITGILNTRSIQDISTEKIKLLELLSNLSSELYSGSGSDERFFELEMRQRNVLQRINDIETFMKEKNQIDICKDLEKLYINI